MVFAGVEHFVHTEEFASIIPNYLPWHFLLTQISGVCEISGGIGLLVPLARKAASLGLIALYIAVFPANINMAVHNMPVGGAHHPLLLWLRLPLQAVLVVWAWWVGKK